MSERGADFLLAWVAENIHPDPSRPEGDEAEAAAKAEECLAAAAADGVSRAEMEAEVGPIASYMLVMMSTPSNIGNVQIAMEEPPATVPENVSIH